MGDPLLEAPVPPARSTFVVHGRTAALGRLRDQALEARGGAGLRLDWYFSRGTHLGYPLYRAHSSSRVHCTYLGSTVLRRMYGGHSCEGPVRLLHIGWQFVRGGRLRKHPQVRLRQLSQCSHCPDPQHILQPPLTHPHPALEGTLLLSPTMEQDTHRTGTTSAPGGWGVPWPGLSQWLDHPRFCLQR